MNNKYLYILVGAIVAAVWFYTGHSAYYKGETGISDNWWYAMILAVGLGAGSTGGDDVVSIFVAGIKDYIPTLILLGLVGFFGFIFYSLAFGQAMPDYVALGKIIVSIMVSGFLTNMSLSYLKKANA